MEIGNAVKDGRSSFKDPGIAVKPLTAQMLLSPNFLFHDTKTISVIKFSYFIFSTT